MDSIAAVSAPERTATRAIVLGGLVAGTLDIGAASLINQTNPIVVLLFIASGLIGKAAFHARADLIALGLFLQWAMSLVIAAIYVFASRRTLFLRSRWVAGGVGYGIIVFIVMNFVVVPLSAAPRLPAPTALRFCEGLAAMVLFGLIVAFPARQTS